MLRSLAVLLLGSAIPAGAADVPPTLPPAPVEAMPRVETTTPLPMPEIQLGEPWQDPPVVDPHQARNAPSITDGEFFRTSDGPEAQAAALALRNLLGSFPFQ